MSESIMAGTVIRILTVPMGQKPQEDPGLVGLGNVCVLWWDTREC